MVNIVFCGKQWRSQLERLVRGVKSELLIVCPFIKSDEVDFISDCLNTARADVRVLTDLKMDSIVAGALDVEALLTLSQLGSGAQVLTLPGLHAKVFIADRKRAIITSGNLTRSGLDYNHEYGVAVSSAKMVGSVRRDMEKWVRAGFAVDNANLKKIARLSKQVIKKIKHDGLSKQELALRQAIAEAQVGTRSDNAIFGDVILQVLKTHPSRTTRQLHQVIQKLFPDLCNDDPHLTVNGNFYGKKWKHRVRYAQQHLKRSGRILYDEETKLWSVVTKKRRR